MAYVVRMSPYVGVGQQDYAVGADVLPEDTNSLKAFRAMNLAADFNWKSVTPGDIEASVTAAMQADAGMVSFARAGGAIAAVAGWFIPQPIGGALGLANLALNAGLDYSYYKTAHQVAKDPNAFWNEYIKNVDDIKADGVTTDFLEQFSTASSYSGQGGQKRLYEKEGLRGGSPFVADMLGMIYRDFSAMNVGMAFGMPSLANTGWVVSTGVSNGLQHYQESVGMGEDREAAYRSAVGVGLIAGATGATFMSALPFAHKYAVNKMLNGSVGTALEQLIHPDKFVGSTLFTGAQAATWAYTDEKLKSMWTGQPTEMDATTVGISFGLGAFLGASANRLSKRAPKAPEVETKQVEGTLTPQQLANAADKAPATADWNLKPWQEIIMTVDEKATDLLSNYGHFSKENVSDISAIIEETYPSIPKFAKGTKMFVVGSGGIARKVEIGENLGERIFVPTPSGQIKIMRSSDAIKMELDQKMPDQYKVAGKTYRWGKGAQREIANLNENDKQKVINIIESMIDIGEWKSKSIDGLAVRKAIQKLRTQ